jgi:competence protein ComEA
MLLVAVAAWWLLRSPAAPVEERLPMASGARTSAPITTAAPAAGGAAPSSISTTGPPNGFVVVQAAGAVARPGVYRLATGARVTDLVAEAGGATPDADLDALALALKLTDGQRVYVPRRGEPPGPAPAAGSGAAGDPAAASGGPSPERPIDLNVATAAELERLPGVGPATASAIVAHRERNGAFASVDELLDIPGIGPSKLEQVRALVTT